MDYTRASPVLPKPEVAQLMKPEIANALQLLETQPDNGDALAALAAAVEGGGNGKSDEAAARAFAESRRVHRDRGDYELVARLFDLELSQEREPARRADLLVEKAKVLGDELLRDGEAEAALQRALEERPGHPSAEEALSHLQLVRGAWQRIVKKCLDEARGSTDRQLTTSLYLSVAESYGKYEPGAPEVEQYLRKALEVEPRNRKAALHLERLLRAAERWTALAQLLEERVEATATRDEKVQALVAVAELQRDRLQRPDLALEAMKRALGIDPAHVRAMGALAEALSSQEDWAGLVKLYENALKARPRGDAELGILVQLGMVWWKKQKSVDGAEPYFAKVRKSDPAHPLMLQFYRAYHGERGEGAKLLSVLAQAQKVERDPKRRLQLGVEMAELAEASAGNAEKAIDIWKGVLKMMPGAPEAMAALKRLYARTEKWNALLELLKEQIDALPKDSPAGIAERVARLTEVVAIYRDKLNLDVMAINTWNTILQLQPDHAGALEALGAKYEAMGRWNDLIGVLQRRADASPSSARGPLLRRIASLWVEKFGNHNQAVKPLEELYALDPGDAHAIAQLRDIYTRRRSWRALLDLERRDADRLQGAERRAKMIEMAKLAAERLGDVREAIGLWNRLLEDNPDDGDALSSLAALYEREKRWPALVEVLQRTRERQSDVKSAVPLLEKIGALWSERLGAPQRAIDSWQQILKLAPTGPTAAKATRTLRELFAQSGDWERLEAMYVEARQYDELFETLSAVAERSSDAALRVRLYGRAAEVALRELKAPERAAKAYERILAVDAHHRGAAEALLPIYRAAEKWPRLLATYEILFGHADAEARKLELLEAIRKLCEEKLGSKQLAFGWCSRAWELSTTTEPKLEAELERLAREADAWEELAVLYADRVAKEPEGPARVARYRKLADLIARHLGRPDEARAYYVEVLKRVPDDGEAQAALERIYQGGGNWKELLAIYQQRLAGERAPAARTELLFKIARLQEEQASDLEAATKSYQEILALDGKSTRALKALARLHGARGDSDGLAAVLKSQLELSSDAEAEAQTAFDLGELYELKLKQPQVALPHYQRAFAKQPTHRPTVEALERYLVEGSPSRIEVARLLAPLYERANDAASLAGALAIVLGGAGADEEVAILRRLVELTGRRLGDVERAYGYAARLFQRQPGDPAVRADLAELADLFERHDEHARLLTDAEGPARERGEHDLALRLAWEAASVHDEKRRDAAQAESAWQRVIALDPRHEGALRALERTYRGQERYDELRALLSRRKELSLDGEERRDLLFQIADLDEGVLEDGAAAARDYQEVLEVEPTSNRAWKALERLFTAAERWRDLDGLLAHAASHAERDADRALFRARRGELHLQKLDDAIGACDLFEEAQAEDPRSDLARKGLERLLQRPELRLRVARTLEPLYAADENWPRLAQVLLAQREKVEGREAVPLLGRIARLAEEKLGSRQQALATWREAMRLDPGDANVRAEVERLATLLERFSDLAQAWEEAEGLADPHDLALRAELLRKAAQLWDQRLSDESKARQVWRRLLDLDPTNLETARPAADALARLYESEEAWGELIAVLRRQSEWAEGAEPRKELLRRIGLIQEDLLEDGGAAVRTYREILDGDSEDRLALDALERLHGARGEWADLIEILGRRVDLAPTQQVRRNLLWKIAQLTDERLQAGRGGADVIAGYVSVLDENPEDLPALEALARLYRGADRPGDLLEILERRLQLATQPAERVALRGEIAALLEGPLRRPDQALERYREMLADDVDSDAARAGLERMLTDEDLRLRAAEVLEPIYAARADGDKMVQLSELWAEHAPDPRERIARLRKIAALRELRPVEDGGHRKQAFEALARAARVAASEPELPSLLDGIERLAAQGNLRAELIALYRELGPDVLDAPVQERVYVAVATESRALGDRSTAREYFRRVLDAAPEHPRALDALESLYAEGRELEPLLEIYNRRAELAQQDPAGGDDKRRYYLQLSAQLCERELGRPAEAMACYEQILELYPTDGEAATSLEALYAKSSRHADLADLLERRLGFADDIDEAVALRHRLGELYEQELSDPDRAVENYRAAMGGDQDHAPSIAALERFLDDLDRRAAAAEVLEPVYAARQDWKSLIRIFEIRLDAADDPQKRLQITRRIARLYEEQLEDLEAAFRWFGKVFREEPGDRAMRDQLARLAQILGNHEELAAVYEDYLHDVFEETAASIEVTRTLAAIYDGRLGDVDRARACYQRLLAHDPTDAQASKLLESLLTRASRWQDLLTVYRDAADGAADPDERKALLYKICALLEGQLGDASGAIDGWRQVLDLDADDARAIASLDRLFVDGKKWHDLADLLLRQLERADGRKRVELKLRLGGLHERELEDLPAAIDAYEEVVQLDPENREAVSALERLVLDHDQRYRIAQILEPIYKAHDEWAKLVVIYDAELEFIDDKARRVERLHEIARIHEERGGDLTLAFSALARAWSEEAGEGEHREAPLYDQLVVLAGKLGAWRELVKVLADGVEGSYDYDLVARAQARIAGIHDERLHDPTAAVESWRAVTAVRDEEPSAWRALERLLGQLDRTAELVTVLERRSELSHDVEEQKQLLSRAAELQEHALEQPDRAVATWRQVLSLDEGDRAALAALARLYQTRQAWRDLAAIYARQTELAVEPAERRSLRFATAQVFEEKLADAFEAISAYKAALEEQPRDLEALGALARLHEAEQQWPDLLEMLDTTAELTISARGQDMHNAVRYRAAKVLEERQGEAEAAIERYRGILDDAPHHEASRIALESLARQPETRELAASVLDPLYRARGEYQPLVDLWELKLTAESDPHARRHALAMLAELNEAGLEDPAGAFSAWGRLLAEAPEDEEAYGQLDRLAELRGAWSELAALYEERLDAIFDTEVQRTLALKLAALYEQRLGDERQAVARYRRALDLPGDERAPLQALDRLLTRGGEHRELAEVLQREADATSDPVEQAELLFRLGEVRRAELVDLDGALAAYRDALDREPTHARARAALVGLLSSEQHAAAALDVLEPLAESEGDHAGRITLAEARLATLEQPADRAALLGRIAEIAERELGDRARALEAASRALGESPEDGHLADEVERLASADAALDRAAAAFESVLSRSLPTETARDLSLRAARLHDGLGDLAAAERRYQAVLEVDAESHEALEALERIHRRGGGEKLAATLERRAEHELDLGRKRDQLAEAARLRANAGDDAAVAAWRRVLDVEESDGEALGALAALHEAAGRHRDLVDTLEQRARYADGGEQLILKRRIAGIYGGPLGDVDRAIDAWRDVLDASSGDAAQLEPLEALEALQSQRGDWLAVQEVLVRKLGAVGAGAAQIPVYQRLAEVAIDHQGAPEDAIGYWQQIVDLAPDQRGYRERLEEILARAEKWYDLVDALKAHAELAGTAGDREGEVQLLVRAADVLEGKLDNASAATEILEKILARDPRNVRALASLATIYEAAHDLDRCKETLERAVALSPGGEAAAEIFFRLGRIEEERLGGAAGEAAAEVYYQRAFEANAHHGGALEALERAARRREDWAKVADLLQVRAAEAQRSKPGEERPLLVELARIYSDRLGAPAGALPYLERAVELAPDDPTILEPLADQYFAAGRGGDALPIYQRLIEASLKASKGRRGKELGRLFFRVGALAETRGEAARALEQYKQAQLIDATHAPTLAALGRLYSASSDWDAARKIYRSMLLQNLDPASGVTKADVYLALGEIHEKLNEGPKAVGMYERGLELDGNSARLRDALTRARALK